MTYRSRNSKLTKDGSEIIMESIKFRLQYDKSFLIHERYLPRKLKLYNNNTITNSISNVTSNHYANVFKYPREDSFSTKAHFNDSTNSFKFYKQPLAKLSPRKSNHHLEVNEDFYVTRNKDSKFRPIDYLKDTSAPIELPLISDNFIHSKHYYQSMKKRTSKMRLRNLLDSGSDFDLNTSKNTDKLNAYVASESSQESAFYLSDKNYEKQLKQIDSYKEFKAKLGYSFSRRLPLASLQQPVSPNFMVLPISRHNPDITSGRDNVNTQDIFKDGNELGNRSENVFDDSKLGNAVKVNSVIGHVLDLEAHYNRVDDNEKEGFESISLQNTEFKKVFVEDGESKNKNEHLEEDSEVIEPILYVTMNSTCEKNNVKSDLEPNETNCIQEGTNLETNETNLVTEEAHIEANEADYIREATYLETNEINNVEEEAFSVTKADDTTLSDSIHNETSKY